MAKHMWCDMKRNTGLVAVFLYHTANRLLRQRIAEPI